MDIEEVPSEQQLRREYQHYPGAMSQSDYIAIRRECGCTTCDCDVLSQNSYREGCHTYGLPDQLDDSSNSTESGGLEDESVGFKIHTNESKDEDIEYFQLRVLSDLPGVRIPGSRHRDRRKKIPT